MPPSDPSQPAAPAENMVASAPAIESRPPNIVYFAGALLIILGGEALVGMIADVFRRKFLFDVAVLAIPLGKRLLRGFESARLWTVRFCIGGLVLNAVYLVWLIASREGLARNEAWLYGGYLLVATVIAVVLMVRLRRPEVRAWFAAPEADVTQSGAWITPLIWLGLLSGVVTAARDFSTDTALEKFYPFEVHFEFRDGQSGQLLTTISHSLSDPIYSSGKKDPFRPRVSTKFIGRDGAISMKLNGFSGRPFDITFASAGYSTETYKVTADTPREVTVSFQSTTGGSQ